MRQQACVDCRLGATVRGFPDCHGTKVSPSGRLPSDLNKPTGSLVAGIPAETQSLDVWLCHRGQACMSNREVHVLPSGNHNGTHVERTLLLLLLLLLLQILFR